MDHQTLHHMTTAAARHSEDATREAMLKGVALGLNIAIVAYEEGRVTREWIAGVRDMIALTLEFSA